MKNPPLLLILIMEGRRLGNRMTCCASGALRGLVPSLVQRSTDALLYPKVSSLPLPRFDAHRALFY